MRWWGWVAVAGMALLVGLPVSWLLSRLAAGPHTGLWVWLVASIFGVSGPVVVVRTQARQVERANLPMVG
jgi:hypothetical protein